MNISGLVNKDYHTISITETISLVRKVLNKDQHLVVIDENIRPVGIIVFEDLVGSMDGYIEELDFNRFSVNITASTKEVSDQMHKHRVGLLSVYEHDDFIGTVSLFDISEYLSAHLERYRATFHTVIHDMRNCITNLIGLNGILESGIEKPENVKVLKMAQDTCNQAPTLLQELLVIEKQETQNHSLVPIDINSVTSECLCNLDGILFGKEVRLILDVPSTIFYCLIDQTSFERVLHNLISNAVKFSYPGSVVYVSSAIDADHITLKIMDQGIGIPLDQQAAIFERFTDISRPGTSDEASSGLGLYFCKSTIEQFNGKIWFESEEGKGTTFFIRFYRQ